MCGNVFGGGGSPKIEKVAPAPTPQTSSDTAAVNDQVAKMNRQKRAARGAQWSMNQSKDTMLTETTQTGKRQQLG